MRPLLLSTTLALVLLAGCGEDRGDVSVSGTETTTTSTTATTPAETTTAQAGAEVEVALSEYSVKPATGTASAGAIAFEAANAGDVPHELEVVKTETKADAFKVEDDKAVIDGEEEGEVEDIEPGGSKTLTAELEAGHYVLLCNLPTHYEQGMRADFEVE
jgi:uncharacterized cupredoxin-like copper-binding protein